MASRSTTPTTSRCSGRGPRRTQPPTTTTQPPTTTTRPPTTTPPPTTTTPPQPPTGQLPRHFLTGYWHNFANAAVELRLSAVPAEYDLVAVAFAEATATPGEIRFVLDPGLSSSLGGYTDAQFRADINTLHARGKRVILSVGVSSAASRWPARRPPRHSRTARSLSCSRTASTASTSTWRTA